MGKLKVYQHTLFFYLAVALALAFLWRLFFLQLVSASQMPTGDLKIETADRLP